LPSSNDSTSCLQDLTNVELVNDYIYRAHAQSVSNQKVLFTMRTYAGCLLLLTAYKQILASTLLCPRCCY